VTITKINIFIQAYGQDIIEFQTDLPEPLLVAEPGQMLSLIARCSRMDGERWVRATFPDVPCEVFNYFSGRLKEGSGT
jgi:hypothetical protein